MELILKRIAKKSDYTIGKLFIGEEYFCDTLEPTWRNLLGVELPPEMVSRHLGRNSGVKARKEPGKTAIPEGRYPLVITKSIRFKKWLPLLMQETRMRRCISPSNKASPNAHQTNKALQHQNCKAYFCLRLLRCLHFIKDEVILVLAYYSVTAFLAPLLSFPTLSKAVTTKVDLPSFTYGTLNEV